MRAWVEELYQDHIEELVGCAEFQALADGSADRSDYDEFIAHVYETHQNSPHFLGFLFSIAPPDSVEHLEHNLLEEMGIEEEGGESHPKLMEKLVEGAGLEDRVDDLRARARARLDEQVQQPILYGSLRELGLGALVGWWGSSSNPHPRGKWPVVLWTVCEASWTGF